MSKRFIVLAVALLLCLFASASAEVVMESAVAAEYGPWSAWTREEIQPQKDVEIERLARSVVEDEFQWSYSRYVYYDEESQKWYSDASYEVAGVPGGRFEQKTLDAPLESIGEGIYEGGWYNEEVSSKQVNKIIYEYRSRSVKRVTCEISTDEILVLPEKTYKLEVNFFDGSTKNTYVSSDQSVASVDQSGNVLGVSVGAAQIRVTSSKGRVVVVDVYVCQAKAKLPEGVYTFRQLGTNKTMVVGKRISSKSNNVAVADFTGDRDQRFIVNNVSANTFVIHPLENKKWFMDIARGGKALKQGANVQVHSRKDRTSQYLRALYVPDGSYILYPKADASLTIGVEPEGAGNNVRLETRGELETIDRWIPIRINLTSDNSNKYNRPVAPNGVSYVLDNFASETRYANGMFFGSNSRRVFVLSCARGKVLSVNTNCEHDYAKTPNATGEVIDPCDASGESLGNYVIIDHGEGVVCLYAHLSKVFVSPGDQVVRGSLIGRSGASGSAEEVGLYLEMRRANVPVNPRDYMTLPDVNKPIGE